MKSRFSQSKWKCLKKVFLEITGNTLLRFYLILSFCWLIHLCFCYIYWIIDWFLEQNLIRNFKDLIPKVVIAWSRLAGIKFCLVLPGSRQCLKLFINYILWLHVKSFIPARREPSFALPQSCFAGTKFSRVIASTCLSGIKKLMNTSVWKNS